MQLLHLCIRQVKLIAKAKRILSYSFICNFRTAWPTTIPLGYYSCQVETLQLQAELFRFSYLHNSVITFLTDWSEFHCYTSLGTCSLCKSRHQTNWSMYCTSSSVSGLPFGFMLDLHNHKQYVFIPGCQMLPLCHVPLPSHPEAKDKLQHLCALCKGSC